MILFYTKETGFTRHALKKLKAAGVTAVECEHVDKITWADPKQVDWVSKDDSIGVAFIRALSMTPNGAQNLGDILLRRMRAQHGINADGTLKPEPKKST